MFKRIVTVYFSPTGGTKNVVRLAAGYLAEALDIEDYAELDFTPPAAREREYGFGPKDLVIVGSPVYAGRLPNKIAPDFKRCIKGNSPVVLLVVYGNRSPGGALAEIAFTFKENGFDVIGGAEAVSRHAFTDALACGRPDERDREEIKAFADRIARKLRGAEGCAGYEALPEVGGWDDIPPYYTPLKEDKTPAKFLKAKPVTDRELCDLCGLCREACPVGSIDGRMEAAGLCIKCQACVRKCPKGAKSFTDGDFLSHVRMLEKNYRGRADNRFYIGKD